MLDKIAEGKVNKFLKENTLLSQALVKNPKQSVEQFIQEADKEATVVAYKRFSLND
jgi:elongation factor Ts